ncbi:MAG: efflux RND transporter permease subunit, partial [Planctomycetaceae bacterium]
EFCIRERLLVLLASVGLIGYGWYSTQEVPLDAIPNVGENQVIVLTEWMGRSPKDMEDQVTYPLSIALQAVPGVRSAVTTSLAIGGVSVMRVGFDADPAVLQPHVRHNIDPGDLGRIGANRDTLDFKLFFSLRSELDHGTQPGWDNWDSARSAWYRVKDAGLDTSPANGQGDTLHNGNAGVTFVQSHDAAGPHALNNVAHALTLMQPGNTVVYFNGRQFGHQRDFPHASRGDVLSVGGGSDLTRIVNARTTHGRGNYVERWVDDQGLFGFERESSAVVLLSNRSDAGFDSRTLSHVGFAPGTYLVELTGNASDPGRDPHDDIPEVIQVFDDHGVSKVNVRFPRNTNANDQWTGAGYAIYGLATPQAPAGLELLNYDAILPGDPAPSNDYENGRQRQTDIYVVNGDQLHVRLQTEEVHLLGSLREAWADGDNALLKLDEGRVINSVNPHGTPSGVDHDQPETVTYGFERFEQKSSPLIGPNGLGDSEWNGDGEFLQTIDLTQLEEGTHFLESRAFRHRTDGGPAVFSSFKKVFYVDRLAPDSRV